LLEALKVVTTHSNGSFKPAFVSSLYEDIGNLYKLTGRSNESHQSYYAAWSVWDRMPPLQGVDTIDAAMRLNKLGELHDALGDYEEAITIFSQSKSISTNLLKSGSDDKVKAVLADSWGGIANASWGLRQNRLADNAYTQELMIREEWKSVNSRYNLLGDLAYLLYRMSLIEESVGNLDLAEQHATESAILYKNLNRANPDNIAIEARLASVLVELGDLCLQRDDCTSNIESDLHTALKIAEKQSERDQSGPEWYDVADTQLLLARFYSRQKRWPEVEAEVSNAVAPARKFHGAPVAIIFTRAGTLQEEHGQLSDAETNFKQAIDIYQQELKYYSMDWRLAQTRAKLGEVYQKTGRHPEAETELLKAVEIQRAAVDKDEGEGKLPFWVRTDLIETLTALRDLYAETNRSSNRDSINGELQHYKIRAENQ